MTLAFVIQALRRHLVVWLISLLVVAGASFAVGTSWPKTYTSHASVLLGLSLKSSGMDPQTANLYLKDRVPTYAELVTSDEVITPVADAARVPAAQLRKEVVVAVLPDTVVLDVSVTSTTSEQAVELTRAVTQSFSSHVSGFNTATGGPQILLAQLSGPQLASEPDQLHGSVLLAVSGLIGLVVSLLLTLVIALVGVGRSTAVPSDRSAVADAGPGSPSSRSDRETTRAADGAKLVEPSAP